MLLLGAFFIGEKFPVKKDKYQDSDGDIRIRKIENGTEKQKIFAPPNGKPIREGSFDKREIQHIYDFAM